MNPFILYFEIQNQFGDTPYNYDEENDFERAQSENKWWIGADMNSQYIYGASDYQQVSFWIVKVINVWIIYCSEDKSPHTENSMWKITHFM